MVNLACSSSSNTEKKGAGLLQGSRSSVVRASTAKVGGLGFDSQWLLMHFFFIYPDLPPVACLYHQFLLLVVVDQYSYKNNHEYVVRGIYPEVGMDLIGPPMTPRGNKYYMITQYITPFIIIYLPALILNVRFSILPIII